MPGFVRTKSDFPTGISGFPGKFMINTANLHTYLRWVYDCGKVLDSVHAEI